MWGDIYLNLKNETFNSQLYINEIIESTIESSDLMVF